uniref:Uncharacterized protein n=1 Tax=Candidatus Kentrum sp. FM TaxID=2126340 RepID=A0A450VYW9_9GAMM|nr:MAG: hypothetical protein BECKFM1743B_GA0114221_101245 [Candidatus Kentron sp. FM]
MYTRRAYSTLQGNDYSLRVEYGACGLCSHIRMYARRAYSTLKGMTTLYAWNTARVGSVTISECTRGAPIPPYKGMTTLYAWNTGYLIFWNRNGAPVVVAVVAPEPFRPPGVDYHGLPF